MSFQCMPVVCCRMFPMQNKDIVETVRLFIPKSETTLSIGDRGRRDH